MHLVRGLAMIQSRMEAERLLFIGAAAPDMRLALTILLNIVASYNPLIF